MKRPKSNHFYIRCMRLVGFLLVLVFVSACNNAFSQNDTVTLKLTITDSYGKRPLSGASLINQRASTTVGSNSKGYVETTILKSDPIFLFSPGFTTIKLSLDDSVLKREYNLHIAMEPLTTGFSGQVIIKGTKSLEKIEEERRKLGTTPKELQKPEMEITSPISALYDLLSNRAKEREKLKSQILEDDRKKIFRELLNYYNENHLIDLPEDHYDDFIRYCNLPLNYLKYKSDYEITNTIVTMYHKYAFTSGLVK